MHARLAVCLAASVTAVVGCRSAPDKLTALAESTTVVARALRFDSAVANATIGYDTTAADDAVLARWLLPAALQEISGLTLTDDGRLLVHNDELPEIWEIDYRRGVLVKRFTLGDSPLKDDFEGIAAAAGVVFVITGKGKLYEFREGANGARVEYTVHDSGLAKACEFESVAFAPAINSLLMVCKEVFAPAQRDSLVIYRWSLDSTSADRLSHLTVPLATLIGTNGWKTLHPSDISVDPTTGNYVIVASIEKAIFAVTPAGAVVFARSLGDRHLQAEGLAITKDGVLIISDEANKLPAAVTLYKWR